MRFFGFLQRLLPRSWRTSAQEYGHAVAAAVPLTFEQLQADAERQLQRGNLRAARPHVERMLKLSKSAAKQRAAARLAERIGFAPPNIDFDLLGQAHFALGTEATRALASHWAKQDRHDVDALRLYTRYAADAEERDDDAVLQVLKVHSQESTVPASELAEVEKRNLKLHYLNSRLSWPPLELARIALRQGSPERARDYLVLAAETGQLDTSSDLSRLGRVFAGAPPETPPELSSSDPLAAVEFALYSVLSAPKAPQQAQIVALQNALADAERSQLAKDFPSFREIAVAFRVGLGHGALPSLDHAPSWMGWLLLRLRLGMATDWAAAVNGLPTVSTSPLEAFLIHGLWHAYRGDLVELSQEIEAKLRALATGASSEAMQLAAILASRKGPLEGSEDLVLEPRHVSRLFDVKGTLAGILCAELDLEYGLRRARRALRSGDAKGAVNRLGELGKTLRTKLSWCSQRLWLPHLAYWRAVALVRTDRQAARVAFEELCYGPKAGEAAAQLALLQLEVGNLEGAEKCVVAQPNDRAAIVYVKALIAERRGQLSAAEPLLWQLAEEESCNPRYVLAARQLLAAIAERQGDLERAYLRHEQAIELSMDAVTAARLVRLHAKQVSLHPGEQAVLSNDDFKSVAEAAAAIPWTRAYVALAGRNDVDWDPVAALREATNPAPRHFVLHSLLAERRYSEALECFDAIPSLRGDPVLKQCEIALRTRGLFERTWRHSVCDLSKKEQTSSTATRLPKEISNDAADLARQVAPENRHRAWAVALRTLATHPADGFGKTSGCEVLEQLNRLFFAQGSDAESDASAVWLLEQAKQGVLFSRDASAWLQCFCHAAMGQAEPFYESITAAKESSVQLVPADRLELALGFAKFKLGRFTELIRDGAAERELRGNPDWERLKAFAMIRAALDDRGGRTRPAGAMLRSAKTLLSKTRAESPRPEQ